MHLNLLFKRIVVYEVKILCDNGFKKKVIKNGFEEFPVLMEFIYYTALNAFFIVIKISCVWNSH